MLCGIIFKALYIPNHIFKQLHSQTVWARDLKFWENVHLSPCATCHMSHVLCHNLIILFFVFFWQNGKAGGWRVCNQMCQPCLFWGGREGFEVLKKQQIYKNKSFLLLFTKNCFYWTKVQWVSARDRHTNIRKILCIGFRSFPKSTFLFGLTMKYNTTLLQIWWACATSLSFCHAMCNNFQFNLQMFCSCFHGSQMIGGFLSRARGGKWDKSPDYSWLLLACPLVEGGGYTFTKL